MNFFTTPLAITLLIVTLVGHELSWAERSESFQVLKQNGDCVYVNHSYTTSFNEGGYRGWICPQKPHVINEANIHEMLQANHRRINDPQNRNEILAERFKEVDAFLSVEKNQWQKKCGNLVKTFYEDGIFDYKYPVEYSSDNNRNICSDINTFWSDQCLQDLLSFELSPLKSEYEHVRVQGVLACGQINTKDRMKFYKFIKNWFFKVTNQSRVLDGYFINEAKHINNEFNRKCIEMVLSIKQGTQGFPKACGKINSRSSLNKVVDLIRRNPDFSDRDISNLSK